MTKDMMAFQRLLEKTSDEDLLREMIGFAAEGLMALEVQALTSAGHGEPTPDRLTYRNGYRERASEKLDHLVQITSIIGGIIVTGLVVIVGVAVKIALGLSRRDHRLGTVETDTKANADALAEHARECREDREKRQAWEHATDERLATGTTTMALLEERYTHLHDDVRTIRDAVVKV